MVMLPTVISAPPIPSVRMREAITRLRVSLRSTLFLIKLLTPTEAMVPNNNNMMPPNMALGMVLRRALTFPNTENRMPKMAAMRMTAGSVILVSVLHR